MGPHFQEKRGGKLNFLHNSFVILQIFASIFGYNFSTSKLCKCFFFKLFTTLPLPLVPVAPFFLLLLLPSLLLLFS